MIEGLSALPWLQEARQEPGQSDCLKCETCMTENTPAIRAALSCGFMPAAARTGESCWQPADGSIELTVCPGYTTTLPDVIDVTHQFHNWENGAIREVCPSGVPKPLLVGLTVFKNAGEGRAAFRLRETAERNKGAGRGR